MIRLKKNDNNRNWFLIDSVLVSIGAIIIFYRMFFGIDLTDSSWYVAEPYLVSKGAIPYVNNWTQTPGFSIPLAVLTKIYTMFYGTEGIFLFSRIEYLVWLIFAGLLIIYFTQSDERYRVPIIGLLPFLYITPHQIFSINYNSIGLIYLLLAFVVLFAPHNKNEYLFGFWSGLIMARAIIATPCLFVPCAVIIVFLFCTKCRIRLNGFVCGGIVAAALVIGWCCATGGLNNFIRGMYYWIKDSAYFKIEHRVTMLDTILELYHYMKIFIVSMVITLGGKLALIKKEKYFKPLLYSLLCLCLIIGSLRAASTGCLEELARWGWFEPIILLLYLKDAENHEYLKMLSLLISLYATVFVTSSISNIYGVSGREYWLYIPVILSFMTVLGGVVKSNISMAALRLGMIMLTLLMAHAAFDFVRRDASFSNLNTKISSGIWKGIYTTEERAIAVMELENHIKRITKKEDKVLFMDWASFGYLMSNGQGCTSTTYDAMQYTYDVNNSEIMYDYFTLTDTVPDKIIYIDFGRDETLSIEDTHWKFNQFVDGNYAAQNIFESKNFRVLYYVLQNKEKALEMARNFTEKKHE